MKNILYTLYVIITYYIYIILQKHSLPKLVKFFRKNKFSASNYFVTFNSVEFITRKVMKYGEGTLPQEFSS